MLLGDNAITSPEDEMNELLKRLLILNYRLKSQIEDLNKRSSTNKQEPEPLQQDSELKKNPLKVIPKDESTSPAFLKSLSVKYGGKGHWVSKDPLQIENENWTVVPSITKSNNPETCTDCKYKEGLEEVLNILSVCGIIKKTTEGEIVPLDKVKDVLPKIVKEDSLDESPKSQKEHKSDDSSKDLRVKLKKNGSEHEFYY
jgi:hypothetical protein